MSRKPGVQNKLTVDMKNMLNQAFIKAGGVRYLVRQAEREPKAFMGLLGRMIPNEVAVSVSAVVLDLGKAMLESEAALKRLTIEGERVGLERLQGERIGSELGAEKPDRAPIGLEPRAEKPDKALICKDKPDSSKGGA